MLSLDRFWKVCFLRDRYGTVTKILVKQNVQYRVSRLTEAYSSTCDTQVGEKPVITESVITCDSQVVKVLRTVLQEVPIDMLLKTWEVRAT